MKICITSKGNDLDSGVDPKFGRCQYFIIVDNRTLEFEAVKNPYISAIGGAGTQSSDLLKDKDVTAVLTGRIGTNAFITLEAAGISVFKDFTGTVKEAVEKYNDELVEPIEHANAGGTHGL